MTERKSPPGTPGRATPGTRPPAPHPSGPHPVRPAEQPTLARPAGTTPRPAPRPGTPARPPQGTPAPRKQPLKVSTPAERAREDDLFADAGLEATEAVAQGKDPNASASILARKHQHAIVRLLSGAFAKWDDASQRAAKRVAENLFDKGTKLVDVFVRMKPRNDQMLERCAKLIGEIGSAEGLKRLRALTQDPTPAVRAAAFEGLARGLDADQLAALAKEVVADKEESPEVKIAAVEALGAARAIGASALCAKVIHDGSSDVRKAATRALTRMGAGAIPAILEDARKRGQATIGVMVDAVRAIIGGGGDLTNAPPETVEQVKKLLTPALRDKASPVRWCAAIALGAIGSKDDLVALDDAVTFEKDELTKANMECARADVRRRCGVAPGN